MAQDYVFDMLYDLIPDKVEEYILRPALEKLFDKCEKEAGYWTYLMIEHPERVFTFRGQYHWLLSVSEKRKHTRRTGSGCRIPFVVPNVFQSANNGVER